MSSGSTRPAQLGADNVVRFLDCAHFLQELAGNLGRGRALVRTRRSFELGDRFTVEVEAPGVPWRVELDVVVVFSRSGFVGLELDRFEEALAALDRLGEAAERADEGEAEEPAVPVSPLGAAPGLLAGEKTLVAPNPVLSLGEAFAPLGEPPRTGSAQIHIREEDEAETGEFPILPGDPIPDPAETGPIAVAGRGATVVEPEMISLAASSATNRRRRPRVSTASERSASGESSWSGRPRPRPMARAETPTPEAQDSLTDDLEARRDPIAPSVQARIVDLEDEAPEAPERRSTSPSDDDDVEDTMGHGPSSRPDVPLAPSLALDDPPKPVAPSRSMPPPDSTTIASDPAIPRARSLVARTESLSGYAVPPPELDGSAIVMNPLLDEGPSKSDDIDVTSDDVDAQQTPPPASRDLSSDLDLDAGGPPAAAPSESGVPFDNLEALEDSDVRLPRVDAEGVVALDDPADLLALYLGQIRHGTLTLFGDLDKDAGEAVRLSVTGANEVAVEALVMARVGPWITLAVPDPSAVEEVLARNVVLWKESIETLASSYLEESDERSRDIEVPEPEDADDVPLVADAVLIPAPPPAELDVEEEEILEAPEPEEEIPEPVAAALEPEAVPDAEPEAEPEPEPEAEAEPEPEPAVEETPNRAPRVPKLDGTNVMFEHRIDLENELRVNLANAGLFVEAPAIPIRERRRLKIFVGGKPTGVKIDADVVFADGGRVGFSVPAAAEASTQLEEYLRTGVAQSGASGTPLPSESPEPGEETPEPLDRAESVGGTFAGRLTPPLGISQVLGLEEKRASKPADLEHTTALQLLEYLVRQGEKGVLSIESKKETQTIWFHGGSVAYMRETPFDEQTSLGRVLISQKKLNDAALREGLEKAKASKKPLGRTLVLLGTIRKSELTSALREQTRLKLDKTFAFESGKFEFGPWREPPGDADLVVTKGLGLLARYLRSRYDEYNYAELEVIFGANMNRRVEHETDFESIATSLQLQPKELRFLELSLDGQRTIHDAVLGSPAGRLGSLRLVGMCLSMALIRFSDGNAVRREQTQVGREPSAFVRVRRELDERIALLRGMNHFEVLGVHWSAHHRNYRVAYDNAKREFNLRKAPYKDAPADVQTKVKEIVRILDGSYDTLNDATQRVSYRKQLFDQTERQYAAEMLVKQGEVALMRGDRVGAIESLETAVELDPSARNRNLLLSAREGRR